MVYNYIRWFCYVTWWQIRPTWIEHCRQHSCLECEQHKSRKIFSPLPIPIPIPIPMHSLYTSVLCPRMTTFLSLSDATQQLYIFYITIKITTTSQISPSPPTAQEEFGSDLDPFLFIIWYLSTSLSSYDINIYIYIFFDIDIFKPNFLSFACWKCHMPWLIDFVWSNK